ncbi:MAG: hypothetical protein LUC35_02050 [Clostridiales bacterium]|nr:hypothetical protein [Clostridiales bacterium]
MDTFDAVCRVYFQDVYRYLMKLTGDPALAEDLPEPNAEGDLEGGALAADQAERAYALLHRMAEPYKEVFLLRALGELSFRQIGALFGKSENLACVTYHRARKKLQAQLEEST